VLYAVHIDDFTQRILYTALTTSGPPPCQLSVCLSVQILDTVYGFSWHDVVDSGFAVYSD